MTQSSPQRLSDDRLPRIGHVTSVHDWYDTRVLHRECLTLARAGYDVTLIAPNAPVGKRDGVSLEPAVVSSHKIRRILTSSFRLFPTLRRHNFDLVHLHDPELIPLGLVLSLSSKAVILDVHEDVRAIIGTKDYLGWFKKPAAALVDLVQRVVSRRMTAVITVTPEIATSIGTGNVSIVANYSDLDELGSIAADSPESFADRGPCAVYVGDITYDRCAAEMISSAALVKTPHAVVNLAGRPADLTPTSSDVLSYHGRLDRSGVAQLLGSAQVAICMLSGQPNYRDARPVKMFEYLAAGLPVIVARTTRWAADFVERHECGVIVDEPTAESLAACLDNLFSDPERAFSLGRNGRNVVIQKYNWRSQERILLDVYRRSVGSPDGSLEDAAQR